MPLIKIQTNPKTYREKKKKDFIYVWGGGEGCGEKGWLGGNFQKAFLGDHSLVKIAEIKKKDLGDFFAVQ